MFCLGSGRGGMLTALLVLFVLMGSFAGYWSATMYKFFNGKKWKRSTLATALLFPSIIFSIFWSLDLMVGWLIVPLPHHIIRHQLRRVIQHSPYSSCNMTHIYKFLNGKKWNRNTLATILLFPLPPLPSLVLSIFWYLDLKVGWLVTPLQYHTSPIAPHY